MDVSYGITVGETNDPYIYKAQKVLREFAEASVPGKYLVDTIPLMKYVPDWFPGAGWKRKARAYAELNRKLCTEPFELVEKRLVRILSLLQQYDKEKLASIVREMVRQHHLLPRI